MGKSTIAELVESNEIAEVLREIGIDYAQGYAIARPAPFDRGYVLMRPAPLLTIGQDYLVVSGRSPKRLHARDGCVPFFS